MSIDDASGLHVTRSKRLKQPNLELSVNLKLEKRIGKRH
jgi:hypothetical protein